MNIHCYDTSAGPVVIDADAAPLRAALVAELVEADWPSVAIDVADGCSCSDILECLRETDEYGNGLGEVSEVAAILAGRDVESERASA